MQSRSNERSKKRGEKEKRGNERLLKHRGRPLSSSIGYTLYQPVRRRKYEISKAGSTRNPRFRFLATKSCTWRRSTVSTTTPPPFVSRLSRGPLPLPPSLMRNPCDRSSHSTPMPIKNLPFGDFMRGAEGRGGREASRLAWDRNLDSSPLRFQRN